MNRTCCVCAHTDLDSWVRCKSELRQAAACNSFYPAEMGTKTLKKWGCVASPSASEPCPATAGARAGGPRSSRVCSLHPGGGTRLPSPGKQKQSDCAWLGSQPPEPCPRAAARPPLWEGEPHRPVCTGPSPPSLWAHSYMQDPGRGPGPGLAHGRSTGDMHRENLDLRPPLSCWGEFCSKWLLQGTLDYSGLIQKACVSSLAHFWQFPTYCHSQERQQSGPRWPMESIPASPRPLAPVNPALRPAPRPLTPTNPVPTHHTTTSRTPPTCLQHLISPGFRREMQQ